MDGWLLAVAALALAWPVPESSIPDPRAPAPGLQASGDAPFGERIDLATGSVSFRQVDVTLEGTGPTIRIARVRSASGGGDGPAAAFGDWMLDVPRIETSVAVDASVGYAWRVGASVDPESLARCSRFDAPHASNASWPGYALHLGDGERQALLKRSPAWTVRPGLPGDFPAVTIADVQVGCLPATRNGEPGEGFLGVAPDGLRYRFDWLVGADAGGGMMQAAMFATRVEDRFGNWVEYVYAGRELRAVVASDGREVAVEWQDGRIVGVTTQPESDASRRWKYEYAGPSLVGVVLPDGSRGAFDFTSTIATLTAPSGLTGRFVFAPSLLQQTWAGPGVDARWDYTYAPAESGVQSVDVTGPDGARVRHAFATTRDEHAGLLLRRETLAANGSLLRTERFAYARADAVPFVARIGDSMRGASWNNAPLETRAPLRERVITQQGRDFTWRVASDCGGGPCFDAFGRPTAVERIGTHARRERTTYADHTGTWVLGQVASVTQTHPGSGATIEPLRIDYDAKTALPLRRTVRGLLQETRTYHADGTLASRSDGRDTPAFDTTIRYGGWMRGIPTSVTFPGGARRRAGVEVDGTIRWVAGETGARTCFAYDAVGRRVRTTWPAESEPTRCGDDDWNETFASFEQSATATPLLPAGHWRHTERTGNGVRITSYDALWRPVHVEEHDAADIANTRRTMRAAFDASGRETFRAYPSTLAVPPPQAGTTTHYDALGRKVRVEKASELGPLVSTTDHLDGFRIRATNARGVATTIERLRAYDDPDAALPESVAYAEGLHVDVERDAFDQPTRIIRRDADGTLATSIRILHDPHGRVCKTIAHDGVATVIGRDVVGNIAWTVGGSALEDPEACQHAEALASGRRVVRTWDARNRLATVAYPDGVGNQAFAWTADSLPSRTTTWNERAGRIVVNLHAWNARRLPVEDALTHPGLDTWVLGTEYDRNGHASVLTYPNGTRIGLVPNALGQPTYVGPYLSGLRWHPDGTPAQFMYGNGIVHTTTRNARGLPERRRDAHGATIFVDETLDYDANANLAASTDGSPGARDDRVHVHDGLDRLVRADSPRFGVAEYDYDAANRLARTSIGGPHARAHHFCRDGAGRLTNVKTVDCANGPSVTGIAHDAAGNLVRMNGQAFAYDAGNRLRRVEGVEAYEYDGRGRRIRETSLRGEGDVLSQYDAAGRLRWQTDYRVGVGILYLYLGERLVAVREQALTGGFAPARYAHADVEGTPVAETQHPDRLLLSRSAYEPFGLPLEGAMRDGVGFRGLVSDAGTGLLYDAKGHVHPMLPGTLEACATGGHILDALEVESLLRNPPSLVCQGRWK